MTVHESVAETREKDAIELVELRSEVIRLLIRAEKAEANYAFMVERAANEKLDGYRELGAKAASAENEAEGLRARLRETAQILIAEVGANGPMDAEDAARRAVERMNALRGLADEKASESGLYAYRMEQAQQNRDRLQERLTAIEKANVDRWKDGYAAAERQIAAWLRGRSGYGPVADQIENGDHWSKDRE